MAIIVSLARYNFFQNIINWGANYNKSETNNNQNHVFKKRISNIIAVIIGYTLG